MRHVHSQARPLETLVYHASIDTRRQASELGEHRFRGRTCLTTFPSISPQSRGIGACSKCDMPCPVIQYWLVPFGEPALSSKYAHAPTAGYGTSMTSERGNRLEEARADHSGDIETRSRGACPQLTCHLLKPI